MSGLKTCECGEPTYSSRCSLCASEDGLFAVPVTNTSKIDMTLDIKSLANIVGVAIQYAGKTYSLPHPNRHHDVIRSIPGGVKGPDVQGFVLDDGTFLGRRGAMQLAQDNGQLKRKPGKDHYQGQELYSEDLW